MDSEPAATVLTDGAYGFSAKYLAVSHLRGLAEKAPHKIDSNAISGLESLFFNQSVRNQTQAYFLFKEAAGTLRSVLGALSSNGGSRKAHGAFMNLLSRTTGHGQRAAAEALSTLPLTLHGKAPRQEKQAKIPVVNRGRLMTAAGVTCSGACRAMGRSLLFPLTEKDRLLVVKLGKDKPESLFQEALWFAHLGRMRNAFPVTFHIPKPVRIDGSFLFRIEDLPIQSLDPKTHPLKGHAIAFKAHPDYFVYPNNADVERQLNPERFLETMGRNAFLFGRLSGLGVIHTAPVPLFHNRVQGPRRNDQGVYLWERGGRLDQWLWSCRYPNFGCSGIRDFEHFTAFKGPAYKAYAAMGAQILSLLLVAGSYFRMKDIRRVGLDSHGRPVDARALFDRQLLIKIIEIVFRHYYRGFVGKPIAGNLPVNGVRLADRMVEEMGVDHYMDEMLRVADQRAMSDTAFVSFLSARGLPIETVRKIKRGENDITLHTGPHLGGFNQAISLPELTEAVGTVAALCIYGRYREENMK